MSSPPTSLPWISTEVDSPPQIPSELTGQDLPLNRRLCQEEQGAPNHQAKNSTTGITRSLPSPSPSSSCSSQQPPTDGATNPEPKTPPEAHTAIQLTVRTRPCVGDLQQHQSMSAVDSEDHPAQKTTSGHVQESKRRCVSANATVRARTRFTSPDRFIAQRPNFELESPSYRTSKSPHSLRGRELYFRKRDPTTNPFRSASEARSRTTARGRSNGASPGQTPPHYIPSFVHGTDAGPVHVDARTGVPQPRQISLGGIWSVGGRASLQFGQIQAIPTGRGGMLASGTNAPMHTPTFLDQPTVDDKLNSHEARLALALEIDQADRVLLHTSPKRESTIELPTRHKPFLWRDGSWTRDHGPRTPRQKSCLVDKAEKAVPNVAFRVLDAPHLKDDYYCSILAYSHYSHTLAVALTHKVYLWTEHYGVRYPPLPLARVSNFVTCLAFSSDEGAKSILAVARHSGIVTLWSLQELRPRFEAPHPSAASSVAFRPSTTVRQSVSSPHWVACEDLLVGDDCGRVYYYSIEWPDVGSGSMSLLAKLDAHSQNICGLAWSPNSQQFVTGGNDNIALLFDVETVLEYVHEMTCGKSRTTDSNTTVIGHNSRPSMSSPQVVTPPISPSRLTISSNDDLLLDVLGIDAGRAGAPGLQTPPTTPHAVRTLHDRSLPHASQNRLNNDSAGTSNTGPLLRNSLANPSVPGHINLHTFSFTHAAAVKAIAFAPWQNSLLATGGGSNDRQIHFHHTTSGTTLAVVNVFAQVTSLVWSRTRREIVATFGYAQPDHEIRIAVFSWPSCECVVSIPWDRKPNGEIGRALWAIAYPGGPNDAVPTRRQTNHDGFITWEAIRARGARGTEHGVPVANRGRSERSSAPSPDSVARGRTMRRTTSADRNRRRPKMRTDLRGEGETWASRTEDEGSLIIACCDQTVKFFEVWAGKSKGKGWGLGTKEGVLGGSRVLEGWCEGVGVDEIGKGEGVIR